MTPRWFAAEAQYDEPLRSYRIRADRIMVGMNAFLLFVCLLLAPLNDTWFAVLMVGVPTLLLAAILGRFHSGELITRLYMGSAFMIFTGLIIHQNAGDIEAHFSAFGLIGVLLYYRDWRTIVTATVVIYLHHLVLGYAQTLGVAIYVFDSEAYWRLFFTHVAYFLPFIAMMTYLAIWLRREGYEDQHVIAMAQQIVQGNLLTEQSLPPDLAKAPLINAVVLMKNRLLDLLRVMPISTAVVRIDNDTLVSVNEAWRRTMGDSVIGSRVTESLICSVPGTWKRLLDELRTSQNKLLDKREIRVRYPNGIEAICEVSVILHEETQPVMAILTLEDVTERRRADETMQRLAFQDMLTDLPNRGQLMQRLEQAMDLWRRNSTPFAVLMMDLDKFKPVNDTYGHDAGDKVLRIVGERLINSNKREDLVARLGGDEFVVLLQGCPDKRRAAAAGERILQSITRPITIKGVGADAQEICVEIGGSIGIAHIADGAQSVEQLLKEADTALYQAKAAGRSQCKLATAD